MASWYATASVRVHRAGVGASDIEVGLHRRQRPAGVPQQVAHGPLTEAGGVIVACRAGADFEEPSGGTIEGMSSWSVHQLTIAAASVQRPYWASSQSPILIRTSVCRSPGTRHTLVGMGEPDGLIPRPSHRPCRPNP